VLHLDIEAHRHAIGRLVDSAVQQGATGVVIDGMAYRMVIEDGKHTVVTVRPACAPDIRRGRKGRRRKSTP
jgi:uncharacterized protein YbjQ (UPF0145 family)